MKKNQPLLGFLESFDIKLYNKKLETKKINNRTLIKLFMIN